MAFKLKLVEILAWGDPQELCRDDRCPFEGVHRAHGKVRKRDEAVEPKIRSALDECVCDWVASRYIRTFSDIYSDVVQDYGAITERGVYRALERLIDARRVIRVVPWPNGRLLRLGAYLRYDSPLIWEPRGHVQIQEQLRECGGLVTEVKPKRRKAHQARPLWLQEEV